MKRIALLLTAIVLSGCATGFTDAKNNQHGFGYRVNKLKKDFPFFTHYSYYAGNAQTRHSDSKRYSIMAAIKNCEKQGKLAILAGEVMDLTSRNWTSNLGTTSNGGLYTYKSIRQLPSHAVMFRCDTNLYAPLQPIAVKSIKATLIKDYMDDFGAAIQVKKTSSTTPGPLMVNDVIEAVNGYRTKSPLHYQEALRRTNGITAKVKILRNKKKQTIDINLTDGIGYQRKLIAKEIKTFCAGETRPRRSDVFLEECLKEHNYYSYK